MQNVYLATRKGLFRFNPTTKTTDLIGFLGDPVVMALKDARDGTLYAALNLGHYGSKLHRSSDDGTTWEEVAVPSYPQVEGDDKNNKSLIQIFSLETGGADEPGVLWAGTIPGGLFRSPDKGSTWHLVESLWNMPERKEWFGGGFDAPGIHSICVHPQDSKNITIGVSCGGVWHTQDGGHTWELGAKGMYAEYMPPEKREYQNTQDPHLITRCAAQPQVMWTQHHNGIFRSEDSGRTWTEIHGKPSKFGFPVAAHPTDPQTAWFVPAIKDDCRIPEGGQVVVSKTQDGGKTFEILREGLPQEHAYDLVFRHALDIDATGDCLAMGSTTGSFWFTDNGGSSWRLVHGHLPPIYAVHFG